jgi:hypothetical protein
MEKWKYGIPVIVMGQRRPLLQMSKNWNQDETPDQMNHNGYAEKSPQASRG